MATEKLTTAERAALAALLDDRLDDAIRAAGLDPTAARAGAIRRGYRLVVAPDGTVEAIRALDGDDPVGSLALAIVAEHGPADAAGQGPEVYAAARAAARSRPGESASNWQAAIGRRPR